MENPNTITTKIWFSKINLSPFSTTVKSKTNPNDASDKYRQSGRFIPTKKKFSEYAGKSILDPEIAQQYWRDIVKKHDYYTYIVGEHFPKSRQGFYYTVHAFLLEILKSRETSRQMMVCKRRLLWWSETLDDIEKDK